MAIERILVRRLSGDRGVVPVATNAAGAASAQTLLVLIPLGLGLIVVVADDLGIRLVLGSIALLSLAVAGYVALVRRLLREGVVRIDTRSRGLHFRPPLWPSALTVVLLVLLVLPAAAVVVAGGGDEPLSLRRSPLVLPILALIGAGVMLWRLRVPPGLQLTVDGLRGIRARGDLAWSWDEVGEVDVVGPPAALTLTLADGYVPVTASMRYLGSDPNQVAAIVRFFRDHPEERAVLQRSGAEALEHAAEMIRPRD